MQITAVNPGIRFTGRCLSDLSNSLRNEVSAVNGGGSQLPSLNRWGDYSSMVVDPLDDTTLWYTTGYLQTSGTFNWTTAIIPIAITCTQ